VVAEHESHPELLPFDEVNFPPEENPQRERSLETSFDLQTGHSGMASDLNTSFSNSSSQEEHLYS